MRRYFRMLEIPYEAWQRGLDEPLIDVLAPSTHVLVLLSDRAIVPWIEEARALLGDQADSKTWVHFSGALVTNLAWTAHPLMTFTDGLYDQHSYERIPYIIEKEGPELSALLPGIPNTSFRIEREKKALYHSLCVLGGNFPQLLWSKLVEDLREQFELPADVVYPFLEATLRNFRAQEAGALTGPLARGDGETIKSNLNALEGDPYQGVYRAFVRAYEEVKVPKGA